MTFFIWKIKCGRIVVKSINYSSKSTDAFRKTCWARSTIYIENQKGILNIHFIMWTIYSLFNNWLKKQRTQQKANWDHRPESSSCHQNYDENLLKRRHFYLLNLCEWLGYKNQASFHPDKCRFNFLLIENLCLFRGEFIPRTEIYIIFHSLCLCWLWTAKRVTNVSMWECASATIWMERNGAYCY